ncbi:hypothetical protein MMYC01_208615 [Madurella mycetomatis]|uniref:Mitochondrial basic amino acids transporter n=1 Tax=Madurella mycetomatis TaxID=100816 RepID=A0A175VT93_9PEZI|nr:hypothetical protein MMYC01_208615 [Madurella mycetomatis]
MSADFWAGYISGAAGIIIGNPLDVLKVRLQAGPPSTPSSNPTPTNPSRTGRIFLLGTAAPVLGYGALNALLFVSYNRTEAFLNGSISPSAPTTNPVPEGKRSSLYTTWLAGAVGGLATWAVSTPTELIKCRAQLQQQPVAPSHGKPTRGASSSWVIAKQVWKAQGFRGLYFGGGVTALRDSIGYGFYFWGYELASRWMAGFGGGGGSMGGGDVLGTEAAKVLLCGGLAGIVTWASIFPLDVVKTRVQTQAMDLRVDMRGERAPLLGESGLGRGRRRLGAWEVAKETYREGGIRLFFRGLTVCSVRAFIVNAVQWTVYEWIMMELGQGRNRGGTTSSTETRVGSG